MMLGMLTTAIEFLGAVKHSEGYYAFKTPAMESPYNVVSLADMAELGRQLADNDDRLQVYFQWCGETDLKTTAELLTVGQLRKLRDEAYGAGDPVMAARATDALDNDEGALRACDEVITGELFRSAS